MIIGMILASSVSVGSAMTEPAEATINSVAGHSLVHQSVSVGAWLAHLYGDGQYSYSVPASSLDGGINYCAPATFQTHVDTLQKDVTILSDEERPGYLL